LEEREEREKRERQKKEKVGNAQVVTQSPREENAHGEAVATQTSISAKNTSDCLVAVFFLGTLTGGGQGSVSYTAGVGRRDSV
jgi:hypothetical protein